MFAESAHLSTFGAETEAEIRSISKWNCGAVFHSTSPHLSPLFALVLNPISSLFFPNCLEFLVQILQAYYTFLSTLDYTFLVNYL